MSGVAESLRTAVFFGRLPEVAAGRARRTTNRAGRRPSRLPRFASGAAPQGGGEAISAFSLPLLPALSPIIKALSDLALEAAVGRIVESLPAKLVREVV